MRKDQNKCHDEHSCSEDMDSVEAAENQVDSEREDGDERALTSAEQASAEASEADERQLVQVIERVADAYCPAEGELDLLLANQLMHTAEGASQDPEVQMERGAGAINLYRSFNPSDGTESILARLSVALTNSSIDCLSRGNVFGITSRLRESELVLGTKLSLVVVEILTLLDKHRQSSPHVNVGNVNVASGGQAIVGNVQSRARSATDSDQSSEEED